MVRRFQKRWLSRPHRVLGVRVPEELPMIAQCGGSCIAFIHNPPPPSPMSNFSVSLFRTMASYTGVSNRFVTSAKKEKQKWFLRLIEG